MFRVKVTGLRKAIHTLDKLPDDIQEKADEIVRRLGELGVQNATKHFGEAQYAGDNYAVEVTVESDGNGKLYITASGQAVLFIEFGTGVTQPDAPEARADIIAGSVLAHGQYGAKHGASLKGWFYSKLYGYGVNPPPGTEDAKAPGMENFIHTYGNPAYPAMYMTKRELIEEIGKIAREVFSK